MDIFIQSASYASTTLNIKDTVASRIFGVYEKRDKIICVVSSGEKWCGQKKCRFRWNKGVRTVVTASTVSSGETSEQRLEGSGVQGEDRFGETGTQASCRARVKRISDRNKLKGPGHSSNPRVAVGRTKRSQQQKVLGWVV